LATVGYVDGVLKAVIDIELLHAKRLKLFGVSNKFRSPEQRAEMLPAFRREILPLYEKGQALPLIYQVLPFEKLEEAKALMDSNQHLGKIVLAGVV
jgi:NADPH:quinone reductase-like Zn-dependent oxidoreductase